MATTNGDPALRKKDLSEALGYLAHPGQLHVHRSRVPRRVVIAGSRWGKSMRASHELAGAMLHPGAERRGWVVAPTFQLTEFIFEPVVAILNRHFAHRILDHDVRRSRLAAPDAVQRERAGRARSGPGASLETGRCGGGGMGLR